MKRIETFLCRRMRRISQDCPRCTARRFGVLYQAGLRSCGTCDCVAKIALYDVSKNCSVIFRSRVQKKKKRQGIINLVTRNNDAEDSKCRCECLRLALHQICFSQLCNPLDFAIVSKFL